MGGFLIWTSDMRDPVVLSPYYAPQIFGNFHTLEADYLSKAPVFVSGF